MAILNSKEGALRAVSEGAIATFSEAACVPRVTARVFATPDAASYCGSSASSFEKLRLTGGGPRFIRITPKRVGYLIEDLNAWLEAKTRLASTSEMEAA